MRTSMRHKKKGYFSHKINNNKRTVNIYNMNTTQRTEGAGYWLREIK